MKNAILILAAILIFPTVAFAQFTYQPPGTLEQSNRQGRSDNKVYVPGMRFPFEAGPVYANSQVYGVGGSGGPAGGQCDNRNYSYPWFDNYCESRRWNMPLCPSGNGHQGQDIRPATCDDNVHWAVAAESGTITNIGSYSVYLVTEGGTQHRYLHMEPSSVQVSSGQSVAKGDRLGRISNAFFSNGQRVPTTIHLHYDLNQNIPASGGNVYVPTYLSLVRSYEELLGVEAEPCELIEDSIELDNSGDCFVRFGNPDFWREETGGGSINNEFIWTNAWNNATPGNWAQWNLHFAQAGRYRVEVNFVEGFNRAKRVRYVVNANGNANTQIVDQSTTNGWFSLGEFDFAEGGSQSVDVNDNTGETDSDLHITVDAVRLTLIGSTQPGEDAGPLPDLGGTPDAGGGGNNGGGNNTVDPVNPPTNDPTDPFASADADDIRVERGCCSTLTPPSQKTGYALAWLFGVLLIVRRRKK